MKDNVNENKVGTIFKKLNTIREYAEKAGFSTDGPGLSGQVSSKDRNFHLDEDKKTKIAETYIGKTEPNQINYKDIISAYKNLENEVKESDMRFSEKVLARLAIKMEVFMLKFSALLSKAIDGEEVLLSRDEKHKNLQEFLAKNPLGNQDGKKLGNGFYQESFVPQKGAAVGKASNQSVKAGSNSLARRSEVNLEDRIYIEPQGLLGKLGDVLGGAFIGGRKTTVVGANIDGLSKEQVERTEQLMRKKTEDLRTGKVPTPHDYSFGKVVQDIKKEFGEIRAKFERDDFKQPDQSKLKKADLPDKKSKQGNAIG